MTPEQIEQKKQLLAEKMKEMKAIYDELTEQREQSDACIDSAESQRKKAEGQLGCNELYKLEYYMLEFI